MTTVTSHSAWPGADSAVATCVCFGMLAAKRSTLIFASGKPRSFSAPTTASIMPSGPQTNAVSTSASGTQCASSASAFARSMRPCSISTSCASRDSTCTRLKRPRLRSLSAASSSRNITVPDARFA